MLVKIENARLSFASLFEPREQLNEESKFEAQFLFPKDNIEMRKVVQDAMLAAGKELWKENAGPVIKALEKARKCFRDGDTNIGKDGTPYEGYPGHLYVVAKSKTRPTVVDGGRNPLLPSDGKPYNGCYVNAFVDIYATNKRKAGGNGVFAELKGVQFVRDGDAFGGGGGAPVSADMFDDVAGEEEGGEAAQAEGCSLSEADDFV